MHRWIVNFVFEEFCVNKQTNWKLLGILMIVTFLSDTSIFA